MDVTAIGDYELTAIGANGCENIATATVLADANLPNATATGGVIDCANSSIQISGSSTTANVVIGWTGPNGFTSTDANPVISDMGTYIFSVAAPNGCISTVPVQVTADLVAPDLSTADVEISCADTLVMLEATTTTGVLYQWTGPNGFVSDELNPEVIEPGTYSLLVTGINGCDTTAAIQVVQSTTPPDISATGGIIDCDQTSLMLTGNSTTPDVIYSWTGPNGFTSNEASPIVNQAGNYELTVMTLGGCMSTAIAQVMTDGTLPDVIATGGIIDCDQNDLMLVGNSSTPNVTYSWTGPNGFTSDQASPMVTAAGTYELTVSTVGGCEAMDTALVIADAALPDIAAVGGTIFCNPNEVQILGGSTTPNVSLSWSGPNGYSSTEANPTVSESGIYVLTVTAANGCMSIENAVVDLDTIAPTLTVTGEDLDCVDQDAQLSFEAPDAISFVWLGPSGYSSSQEEPIVTTSGIYEMLITGANGCENSATVNVGPSGDIPDLQITGGQLDCDDPSLNLIASSTDPTISSYSWTGPNGFLSSEAAPLINQPGDYFVTITNVSGCENIGMTSVIQDAALPTFSLVTNYELNCNDPDINLMLILADPSQSVAWTGPNGFNSTTVQPLISEAGNYEVLITAANGCQAIGDAIVIADFTTPIFTIDQTEITCADPQAQMEIIINDTNVTVDWQGAGPIINNGLMATTNTIGNYSVTVTGANGCPSTENVEITGSTDIPLVSINNLFLNCNNPDGNLTYQSSIPLLNINWTGPNGFSTTTEMPLITEAGLYSISGITSDGCPGVADLVVQGDFAPPVLSTMADEINCLDPEAEIIAIFSDPAISISWTGPNGYSADGTMQSVASVGDYIATATAANGCTTTSVVTVTADNDVPMLNISGGAINCANPQTLLAASADIPGGNYSWMFDNDLVSNTDEFLATAGGDYTVSYNLSNGCIATEVFTVAEDFIEPDVSVSNGFINCINTSFTLTPITNDIITNWEWSGPNGFSSQAEMPVVFEEGIYNLTSTASNGCNTHVIVNVFADLTDPDFTGSGGVIDCNNPEIALQVNGNSNLSFDFDWTGPNNFISDQQNPLVSNGGQYDLLITGANGCTQLLSVFVDVDTLLPNFSLDGGVLTCIDDNLILGPNDFISGVYEWTGPNGFSSNNEIITVTAPGDYNLIITPDNGCENEQTTTVIADQSAPILMVEDGHISCAENELILVAASDVNGTASWTGPNNFVATDLMPIVEYPGVYNLVFTSSQNGCSEAASLVITQDDPLISAVESEDPNCPGELGNFIFTNTIGGVAPYVYSIDGGATFSNEIPAGDLASGNYSFVVQDAGECQWDTAIVIEPAPFYYVQLNSEIEIEYGDEVQLIPNLNFPNSQIQSINWSPAIGLSCTDCLTPMANPFQDTRYELTITTNEGCVTEAEVLFRVNNEKDLYIPNVFSPNNDGNNDAFTVFGDEERIERINEMIIVDRWGEIVYRAENFPVNDFAFGWDGVFKGEKMNAAVFVYHLQVLWKDGTTDWFNGDVTLIR